MSTGGAGARRFRDTVSVTEKTAVDIADSLTQFGVRNPVKPYLRKQIGKWVSDDFEENERITKTWEVTEHVQTPATYEITLRYTKGWWGASLFRVALTSAPQDQPSNLTDLSVDEHKGNTGYRSMDNTYVVTLSKRAPKLRYFVVADIKGVRSSGKPENRQGCNGGAWLKARLPDDWRTSLR